VRNVKGVTGDAFEGVVARDPTSIGGGAGYGSSVREIETKFAILVIVAPSNCRASVASYCKLFSRPVSASAYF
jgi:hypothetical protein